jgi:hypothetical protein
MDMGELKNQYFMECHSDVLKKCMEEELQLWILGLGFSRHKFTKNPE